MTLALPSRRLPPQWVRNDLWRRARAVPSLDLQFADRKSLVDGISGQNLITFTRASSGTYVDSDGLIKTATTNLKTFSENFSDASYSVFTRLTVTSDALAAPNGTVTADKLVATSNNDQKFVETTASVTSGLAHVFGIFAKKAEYEVLQISVANNNFSGTLAYANFNLDSGSIVSSVDCTPVIQTIGDGWYRCSVIMAAATSTGTNAFRFSPYSSGNPGRLAGYTGDGTSGIYIWGAQLEQSSTVGEYIPTGATINSAPRFDHDPTTGESLGLLVEEQRVNLVTGSATFQPSSGGSPASYTVDQVAPDGTTTASRQTAANPRTFIDYQGIANAQYTFSVYAKAVSGTVTIAMQLKNAASDTVITVGSGVTLTTAWQRLTVTGTTNGATTGARIEVTGPVTGAPVGTVFWGAQLEVGSGPPTSYIPTTDAAATRAADVASITGSAFSSWYRQDEGTVFAETNVLATATGTNRILQLSGATTADRHDLFFSGGTLTAFVNVGGVAQVNAATSNSISANQNARSGYAYKQNDFSWMLNAGPIKTEDSGTLPAVDRAGIGVRFDAAGSLNGHIRRLVYWPQRLGNEVLQRITQ